MSVENLFMSLYFGFIGSILAPFYPLIILAILKITSKNKEKTFKENFLTSITYILGIFFITLVIIFSLSFIILITFYKLPKINELIFNFIFSSISFGLIISAYILCYLYLAGSLFGFYKIYIPFFTKSFNKYLTLSKKLFYSFLFGIVSGIFFLPFSLYFISASLSLGRGNIFMLLLSFFLTFFGMSLVPVLIGTFSRFILKISELKEFMGFILVGYSIITPGILLGILHIEPTYFKYLFLILAAITFLYYILTSNIFIKELKINKIKIFLGCFLVLFFIFLAWIFGFRL
ncbi:hypothetical protein K9L05_00350 [Candidatus Babeliales bacterium]|nr:hypothetical protein [Candidatus Babeliales bacterium]